LGAALGTMVANLSAHKRGWENRWEEFSEWAEKGKYYHTSLLNCVDEDTQAFNQIMKAFELPKTTQQEITIRKNAIQEATKNAIEVPLKVMQLAHGSMEMLKAMAESGNPNSVSDAGVGVLCARTAVEGAFLNVKINAAGLDDKFYVEKILKEATNILCSAKESEVAILEIVHQKISG
jgi:glutamate formiminotransferase/formiminotetrahydrofolate cyclodeaminase